MNITKKYGIRYGISLYTSIPAILVVGRSAPSGYTNIKRCLNHIFITDLTSALTPLPALSTRGAESSAPPGIGNIPNRAGDSIRIPFFPTLRFCTSNSIKCDSSITPPIRGMIPTEIARRSIEGSLIVPNTT